jgi:hypothetical protein
MLMHPLNGHATMQYVKHGRQFGSHIGGGSIAKAGTVSAARSSKRRTVFMR